MTERMQLMVEVRVDPKKDNRFLVFAVTNPEAMANIGAGDTVEIVLDRHRLAEILKAHGYMLVSL